MKPVLLLLSLSVLLFRCSHTKQYSSSEEVNQTSLEKTVEIETIWDSVLHTEHFHVGLDSAHWTDRTKNKSYSLPLSSIHKISIIDRKKGAWYGFRNPLYLGTGLGLLVALNEVISESNPVDPRTIFGGFIALGGFYGLTVGAPVGGLHGYRYEYIVSEVAQPNKATTGNAESPESNK